MDTGCGPPGLQEAAAQWGRGRCQGVGAQGLALSEALNQVGAGQASPPCTPGGWGAGRWGDCCGYCCQLLKASGHSEEGERVLGQTPQAIGGRGSWGAQPWPDPFSWEAGRRAPLHPLRAPRTGPGALGAPRVGPQPREGQGPPKAVA